MPRSKRHKLVSLTKTHTDRRALKQGTVEKIQSCVDEYSSLFVLSFDNLRSNKLKELRSSWLDSRLLLGKNSVMAVALGRSEEDEFRDNLHMVSQYLVGEKALLFTNRSDDEVRKFFSEYNEIDYARSGATATDDVSMKAGDLTEAYDLPHTMTEQLRTLGMPVDLVRGKVILTRDHVVCRTGDVLSPEQARLLKLFWKPMAVFTIGVVCHWSNDGKFQVFESAEEEE